MKTRFAVAVLGAAATLFAIAPANAQYWDPYGRPPPPRWERPAPGYGYDYDRPRPRVPFGRVCETSRGACNVRPGPVGAGCRCMIPGFGPKRGVIEY